MTPPRLFETQADFLACLHATLQGARQRIDWFEYDFSHCEVGNRQTAALLESFLTRSPRGEIRFLLHDSEFLRLRGQRLTPLLERWSHRFSVRMTAEQDRGTENHFLVTDIATVRRFHVSAPRGAWSDDGRTRAQCTQHFEALWQRTHPYDGWRRLYL
jgi:hypothetical protein